MALQNNTATIHGLNIESAYHRVDNVSIVNKSNMTFHVYVYVHVDKPFFSERTFQMTYDIDGENPVRQAYLHLKTLPEFANAVDC